MSINKYNTTAARTPKLHPLCTNLYAEATNPYFSNKNRTEKHSSALSLGHEIFYEFLSGDASIAVLVDDAEEVLHFGLVAALQHLSQLLQLDVAGVVDVEVLEGFSQGLPEVELAPVVHGDDELVEIDLARIVDVH